MGTEVIALQQTVERRHLGIATAGVRFVDTLGRARLHPVGALFATGLHSSAPAAAAAAVHPVFGLCAGVMAIAAAVALAMPLRGSETTGVAPARADETTVVASAMPPRAGESAGVAERRGRGRVGAVQGLSHQPVAGDRGRE